MSQLPFPESILRQHSATLGKTGAGKSSALRVSVEHLLDKNKRVVILDPKGDWWGLKASADGKGPGYPVITFGAFKNDTAADVPTNIVIPEQKSTKVDPERENRIAERAAKQATAPLLKRLHELKRYARPVINAIEALREIADAEIPPEPAAVEVRPMVPAVRTQTNETRPSPRTAAPARLFQPQTNGNSHGTALPINRNDLDEPTGYKRSSRDAYLSRLAARRLVETPGSGLVQAAGALFD